MKRKLFSLLTLLLTVCSGAWADDTTVSATQFTASQSGTTYTVSAKSGSGSLEGLVVKTVGSGGGVSSNRLKVPAGTLEIETSASTNVVKSVTITWRDATNNYPSSDSDLTSSPSGVTTSSKTSTWSGSAKKVTFTNTTSNTFQVVGLSVTYGEGADEGGESGGGSTDTSLFSITMGSTALGSVTQNTEVELATTYATITGGTAYLGNKNSDSTKAQINNTNGVYFSGNDAYVKIVMDEALNTGDEIVFTNPANSNQICFTTSNTRSDTEKTTSGSYTVGTALNGQSTIYVWRATGSGTYLKTLTITRSTAEKHSVTYDLGDGTGTAPTQDDVAEGKTFTVAAAPVDLVPPTGKEFKCWNDGENDYEEGDTYTMSTSDVTLTAVYQDETVKYTVTYSLGEGSGTAPLQESLAEGKTFTVAAAPDDLVAPTGKAFVCWNDGSTDYNAGDTYTIGTANVTLTAQYQDYYEVYDVTGLSFNEFVLTQANITDAVNGFVTTSTDNWGETTPTGYDKTNYYNLSNSSRYITFKVKGAENFMVVVRGGGGDRSCDIKIGSDDATNLSVPQNATVTSQLFETGSTGEVTITITGTGNSVYPAAIIFNVPNTTITLNGSGFATFSSAYDFTFSGAQAYKMALDLSGGTLTGTEVTGKVKAGEGILFKGDANAEVTIVKTTGADALTGNNLHGTTDADGNLVEVPADKNSYVLSGDTFKKFTGAAFTANKAFFLADGDSVEGRTLTMVFDDGEATGIDEVQGSRLKVQGDFYDLQGRKVVQPTKGLYIVNGLKVVVK